MQKWEYKIVKANPKRSEDVLNKLGAEGWEVVGFHPSPPKSEAQGIGLVDYEFVLKRVSNG